MKLLSLLFSLFMIPASFYAQKVKWDSNSTTISANYSYSDPSHFGISAEFGKKDLSFFGQHFSTILNLSMSQMTYDNNLLEVKGQGFTVELGHRFYKRNSSQTGVYIQWLWGYSNTNFDENTALGNFSGNYSYWSLINNDIGYKIRIGNNFSIDPSIGYNWKWEVKGKGDIDNIYSDNFVFRCGVKMGVIF